MSSWIGSGPAGENAAQYAIQGSERTAVIVEAELGLGAKGRQDPGCGAPTDPEQAGLA